MIPDSVWLILVFLLALVAAGLWNRALRAEADAAELAADMARLRAHYAREGDALWGALSYVHSTRVLTPSDQGRVADVLMGGAWTGPLVEPREGAA